MKIPHILDRKTDKELRFTHFVQASTGELISSCTKPSDFDNFNHITGNLYYAWDNGKENQGFVVLGEIK